jgi:hypothetical protein
MRAERGGLVVDENGPVGVARRHPQYSGRDRSTSGLNKGWARGGRDAS